MTTLHMNTSTKRQNNYRQRLELEQWINYYFKKIKTTDPTHLPMLQKHLIELEKITIEYIQLNKNKGEQNVRKK